METKTLTNGIAMSVLPQAESVREVQGSNVIARSEMTRQSNTSETKPVILSDNEESFSGKNHNSEFMTHDSNIQVLADNVLKSAKEEGFEGALQHLADGDFEDDEAVSKGEELDEVLDVEISESEEEPLVSSEMQYYVEKVQILEEKVDVLMEKNKELTEKMKKVENVQAQTIFTLVEIARIYEAMIKEETNVESKAGLLEILIQILTDFINELMDSVSVDEKNEQDRKKETEGGRSLSEIVSALQVKGEIRSFYQIQQDRIENPAA